MTKVNWAGLMKLRLKKTGLPLTWAHLVVLASALKLELMQTATQTANEGWSSDNLRRHLQRATGKGNRRPGTGRTINTPGSIAEGLQQLFVLLNLQR